MTNTIVISFFEGRVVRDFFSNGIVEKLSQKGFDTHYFSPVTTYKKFSEDWDIAEDHLHQLLPGDISGIEQRVQNIRARILKHNIIAAKVWIKLENILPINLNIDLKFKIKALDPKLIVITNPMLHYEIELYNVAKKLGIPTLGILRSWDNIYKGLRLRTDYLAVWNEINKTEAIALLGYEEDQVFVTGAAQFDPYFDQTAIQSRDTFLESIGFSSQFPVITLATLGTFINQYDETYLMDWLISAREMKLIPQSTQLICRLHPASKLEHFKKYEKYFQKIYLSWIDGYIPTLGWTMGREEVQFIGNMLCHSDVVLSPGSTITIETAIFDTPTLVPIFHTYQPELAIKQFGNHLSKHFRRLKELKLIQLVESEDQLDYEINRCLNHPYEWREQRKKMVEDYVCYTDGKSAERIAELITTLANLENGDWR